MLRRALTAMILCLAAMAAVTAFAPTASAQESAQPPDWQRFYYYPYVYYPHNFVQPYSYNHMYYKYPQSRQIPVYNEHWHNFYPSDHPWHSGHHFILDVF